MNLCAPNVCVAWLTLASAPFSALANAPFTNHLGMVFVSVAPGAPQFSRYKTRVRDFAAFADTHPLLDGTNWLHPRYHGVTPVGDSPDCPVVNVSWADATAFCIWLTQTEQVSKQIGPREVYRLPTDAEWSLAAGLESRETGATPRAKNGQVTDVFIWGTQFPPPPGAGNFADETAKRCFTNWPHIAGYDDGYATTAPVGRFKPTAAGLYDLAGNALEWCQDWYDDSHKHRVLRGGSWLNCGPRSLFASAREHAAPHRFSVATGFRCVLASTH
jgi:formylglycine-generating enzyme required for sulfatase activity